MSASPRESPFVNVIGQAGVESLHGVTVRVPQGDDMGMAEEDFEWTFGFGHIRPVLEVMKRLYNQKQTERYWGKILV